MLADADADAAAARDAARREEDVSLLLLRWAGAHAHGRGDRLYCVVGVDALPFAAQVRARGEEEREGPASLRLRANAFCRPRAPLSRAFSLSRSRVAHAPSCGRT